ncbi:MAG: hypothetical protein PSV46_23065 [Reyranella sp.]|nr:hypothetical protein [Reyranella sp.]
MLLLTLARSAALFGATAALEAARQAAVTAASYLLVGALLTVSLGFLTLSGYRAILSALGDVYAALIIGCVYLVAALIAMLAVQTRRQ